MSVYSLIKDNDLDGIKKHFNEGGDLQETTALMFAVSNGRFEVAKLLAEIAEDKSIFTDVDSTGKSALLLAVWKNHPKIVELCLDNRSDLSLQDKHGNTALQIAAVYGHFEIAKLLVEKNNDPKIINIPDNGGNTALHHACYGETKIAKLLISNNADLTLKNKQEMTSLDIAVQEKNDEIVQLLKTQLK